MSRINPLRIKHEVEDDQTKEGGEIKLELDDDDDDDYLECTVEGFIKIELNQSNLTENEGANPMDPSNANKGVFPQQCKLVKKEEQHDETDLGINIKNDANQCSDEYRFVTIIKYQGKEEYPNIDVVLIWNGLFYYMPKSMYKREDYNYVKKRELWVKKEELDEILNASELRYTFSAHIVKKLEEEERVGIEKGFHLSTGHDLKWDNKMKMFVLKSRP